MQTGHHAFGAVYCRFPVAGRFADEQVVFWPKFHFLYSLDWINYEILFIYLNVDMENLEK